jgi:hypothetical protein
MIGDERWLQLILRPRHALWDVPPGLNDQLVIEMAVAALIDSLHCDWAYVRFNPKSTAKSVYSPHFQGYRHHELPGERRNPEGSQTDRWSR